MAQAWRRPAADREPERLTVWQAPFVAAIWTVILYGFLPTTWVVAAVIATLMVLVAMRKRPD